MKFPQLVEYVEKCKSVNKIPHVIIGGMKFWIDLVPDRKGFVNVDLYGALEAVVDKDIPEGDWEHFSHKNGTRLREVPINDLPDDTRKKKRIAEHEK